MSLYDKFPQFIGFDSIFNHIDSLSKTAQGVTKDVLKMWPPYNVVKTGDNTYKIQIACAGFSKSDIDVELDGNRLVISGNTTPDSSVEYLHKGISEKAFSRQFTLADSVEVKNAEMVNGMLEVVLENQAKLSDHIRKITVK